MLEYFLRDARKTALYKHTQGYRNKKKNRLNSTFYSDENYNTFDVDFCDPDVLFPYNQFKLDHKHSLLECRSIFSQTLIKLRFK